MVFSFDEKQCQALDRTQPSLPPRFNSAREPERMCRLKGRRTAASMWSVLLGQRHRPVRRGVPVDQRGHLHEHAVGVLLRSVGHGATVALTPVRSGTVEGVTNTREGGHDGPQP